MELKVLVLFLTSLFGASLSETQDLNGWRIKYEILQILEENNFTFKEVGSIIANIDEWVDKILPNINKVALKYGLEPLPLGDLNEDFLVAHIKLKNGTMDGISQLKRYDSVLVTYQSQYKTLNVALPLEFPQIDFLYNYHADLFGVGPTGNLTGDIKHFKVYIAFQFNFNTLTAEIDNLKVTDGGDINFIFSGNLTDIIMNILSKFVTTVLHPIIQGIIEGIIKHVGNDIVNEVNEIIYNVTHFNETITYVY